MNHTRPLTAKQSRFVQNVVSGYSLADSYRYAYDTNGRSATVRVDASRLAKQPHIVAALHRHRLATQQEQLRHLQHLAHKVGLLTRE